LVVFLFGSLVLSGIFVFRACVFFFLLCFFVGCYLYWIFGFSLLVYLVVSISPALCFSIVFVSIPRSIFGFFGWKHWSLRVPIPRFSGNFIFYSGHSLFCMLFLGLACMFLMGIFGWCFLGYFGLVLGNDLVLLVLYIVCLGVVNGFFVGHWSSAFMFGSGVCCFWMFLFFCLVLIFLCLWGYGFWGVCLVLGMVFYQLFVFSFFYMLFLSGTFCFPIRCSIQSRLLLGIHSFCLLDCCPVT